MFNFVFYMVIVVSDIVYMCLWLNKIDIIKP